MNRRIQDISLPGRQTPAPQKQKPATKKAAAPRRAVKKSAAPKTKRQSRSPKVPTQKRSSKGGAGVLWSLAIILLLVLGYVISHSLSSADVSITLKQQRLTVEEVFSAFQDTAEGQLDFDTVVFEGETTKTIADAETETVSEKASGTIVVYNAHQTTPQRLIEETRFQAANGQIYKTGVGVTTIVPGYTMKDGELVPGSATVQVYAADPGPDYNQGPTDFKIPGFEGTPKFDGFYARSETSLEGGFAGERPVMGAADREEVATQLAAELRLNAESEAGYRIPEGYMVIPGALSVATGAAPEFTKTDTGFMAKLSSDVTALLIKKAELQAALLAGQEAFADLDPEALEIVNLSELSYDTTMVSENEIQISVSGDMLVRWLTSEEDVKRLILGTKKRDFQARLETQPAIQAAQAEVRPTWVTTFPKKLDHITVIFQNIDQ